MVAETFAPVHHPPSEPLGPVLSDREFQELLDTIIPRSPAKQFALRRLRQRMSAQGRVTLPGGVRGWAEVLNCSLSRPREMLEEMAEEGLIALDILREPGGWVAQLTILAAFGDPDRSVDSGSADPVLPPPSPQSPAPHQDALNDSGDRSPDDPPHTPHVDVHESMCGGGGDAKADSELADQDRPAYQELVTLGVAWEEALLLAPLTSLAQIAYLKASGLREPADDLPAWVVAGIRAGRRPPPRLAGRAQAKSRQDDKRRAGQREEFDAADARAQIARLGGVASPPPAAEAPTLNDGPTDAEIADCAALTAGARAEWRRRFWAAPPDGREAVLVAFREAVVQLDEAPPPNESPAPPGPRGMSLGQIWHAALDEMRLDAQERNTWFTGAELVELNGAATVSAASPWHRDGLEDRYRDRLRRALGDVIGRPVLVRFIVRQAAVAAD